MKLVTFKLTFISLIALSFVIGCTTASLENGKSVQIVDGISATDLLSYENVKSYISSGKRTLEDCRNDLRNQAESDGVEILRITSTEPAYCLLEWLGASNAPKDCIAAHADGFRSKIQKNKN